MLSAQVVIDFWFSDKSSKHWFRKDPGFDEEIRQNFSGVVEKAARGELLQWRQSAEGRLAEIIVLDQFPRNIFRNSAQAFMHDNLALILAQEMVLLGLDKEIDITKRAFVYMPYMHSESLVIHTEAVKLFSTPGLEDNLNFLHRHTSIIERFGRYPHRNDVLGRISSKEESTFLQTPGSSF